MLDPSKNVLSPKRRHSVPFHVQRHSFLDETALQTSGMFKASRLWQELLELSFNPWQTIHTLDGTHKLLSKSIIQIAHIKNISKSMVLCGGLVCWCLHTLRLGLSIFVKTCCQCLTCLQWNDWLMALQDAFQGVFTFKRIIFRTCYIVQCWFKHVILGDCSKKTARLSRRFHQFRPWKFASAAGVESIPPYIAASNGRASTTVHLCPPCSPPRTPFCGHFLTHKWHDGSAQLGTTSSQPW